MIFTHKRTGPIGKLVNGKLSKPSHDIYPPKNRPLSQKEITLKMTGKRKTLGLDELSIKVWKVIGVIRLTWLTNFFNEVLTTKKMQDNWRKSIKVTYRNALMIGGSNL